MGVQVDCLRLICASKHTTQQAAMFFPGFGMMGSFDVPPVGSHPFARRIPQAEREVAEEEMRNYLLGIAQALGGQDPNGPFLFGDLFGFAEEDTPQRPATSA